MTMQDMRSERGSASGALRCTLSAGLRCQATVKGWVGGRATVGAFSGRVYYEVGYDTLELRQLDDLMRLCLCRCTYPIFTRLP